MSLPNFSRVSNLVRGGVCLVVAVSVGLIGVHFGQRLRPVAASNSAPAPVLVVAPSALSLGDVWENPRLELNVPIENVSDNNVDIEDFVASCDCVNITPRTLHIPAGESRSIRVVLDLAARIARVAESGSNSTYREFVTTIKPKVKDLDPVRIEEWSVTGRVRSAIRLDVPELWFENTSRLAPLPEPKTAVVMSFVELDHLTVTCSTPNFLVTATRLSGGKEGYSIRVGPRKMLPVGPFRESVRIVPCLVGGTELPTIELPVVGQIVPDIQAVPPSVAFGVQPIGEKIEESFTLRSRTGSPIEVRTVRATSEGLTVTERTDPKSGVAYHFARRC